MQIVAKFDPTSATSGTFNAVLPGNRGKILVYNESAICLQLTFSNGYTSYVPAWWAMPYCAHDLTSPVVQWEQQSILTSSGGPISQVVVEIFDVNEPFPGTYPAPLVRQTNIGNPVTVAGGSLVQLINDANAAGTVIVEATPLGYPGSAVSLDNEGNLTLGRTNHPATFETWGSVGNVDIDSTGHLTVVWKISANLLNALTGNDLTLGVETGHKLALQVNNADVARVDSAGVTISSGAYNFLGGSLSRIKFGAQSGVTNAGTTVTHGLGAAPEVIFCTLDNAGVNETAQANNVTSTTFNLTTSGVTGRTVWWLALKS